jgi:hypothetical protein
MNKEITYLNQEGNQVFTSTFLRQRKTCCKTGCLHCPYGHTIKKYGLKFRDLNEEDLGVVYDLLLKAHENFDVSQFSLDNIKLMSLKDQVCGVIFKNHIVIKKLVLLPEFQDQGISKELAESYYFV